MYAYNLIIKRGDLDHDEANVMVMMEITDHFDPLVRFTITAILDNEVVATVWHGSKRTLQGVLGDWFGEGSEHRETDTSYAKYPIGTLLHYREILPSESLYNRLGG